MTLFRGLNPRSSANRVQRCCARWQKAFPDAEIVYPVRVLGTLGTARWVREQRLRLSVGCDDDLAGIIEAGVALRQVVLHCDELPTRTIWQAVGLGIGQFVVGSFEQLATLSACVERPQSVILDVTESPGRRHQATDEPDAQTVQAMVDQMLEQPNLEVCGLHSDLDRIDTVEEMIAGMAELRYHRGVLCGRLSVAVSGSDERPIEAIASQLNDTVEGGCARFRYPRPVVQVCPDWFATTREM